MEERAEPHLVLIDTKATFRNCEHAYAGAVYCIGEKMNNTEVLTQSVPKVLDAKKNLTLIVARRATTLPRAETRPARSQSQNLSGLGSIRPPLLAILSLDLWGGDP